MMSEQGQKISIHYVQDKLKISPTLSRHIESLPDNELSINAFNLSCDLQAAAGIHELIETYSKHIQRLIPHSGISYINKLLDIEVFHGTRGRHNCSYNLSLSKQSLGLLSLSYDTPYSEQTLEKLEASLSILFYPLGHALYN